MRQEDFFDIEEHQYAQALVERPPLHTAREIDTIISRLRRHRGVASVVDFGAGSGRLTIPCFDNGTRCWPSTSATVRWTTEGVWPGGLTCRHLLRRGACRRTDGTTRSSEPTSSITSISTRTCRPSTTPSMRGRVVFSEPGGFNLTGYVYLPLTAPWHIERGVRKCTYRNLKRKLERHGFSEISISGLGLLPRPFFNWSARLSALNDALGDLPLVKLFAYRYIIQASAGLRPPAARRPAPGRRGRP